MHCKGKTQSGKHCTRKCKEGSKFCWQHQQKSHQSPKKSNDLQKRYCKCLLDIEKKSPQLNKYAICTASVGRVSKYCKEYGH